MTKDEVINNLIELSNALESGILGYYPDDYITAIDIILDTYVTL